MARAIPVNAGLLCFSFNESQALKRFADFVGVDTDFELKNDQVFVLSGMKSLSLRGFVGFNCLYLSHELLMVQ